MQERAGQYLTEMTPLVRKIKIFFLYKEGGTTIKVYSMPRLSVTWPSPFCKSFPSLQLCMELYRHKRVHFYSRKSCIAASSEMLSVVRGVLCTSEKTSIQGKQ